MSNERMKAVVAAGPLRVTDLGRLAYTEALVLQHRVNRQVAEGVEPPVLLLVEHDPVITISRRKSAPEHLLASASQLRGLGIDVQPTDRGGDITYHGPGQLVAYPVLCLRPLGLNLGGYMRMLERVVIETLAVFGLEGRREAGHTGVWVDMSRKCQALTAVGSAQSRAERGGPPKVDRGRAASDDRPAKICALGVRIRRNVTMHGLALNVDPDLSHFNTIVPCGLNGRAVTSLRQLLPAAAPGMGQVKWHLARAMQSAVEAAAAAVTTPRPTP